MSGNFLSAPKSSEDLNEQVSNRAEALETGKNRQEMLSKRDKFGICWNCTRFRYKLTRYGKEIAECAHFDTAPKPLHADDPLVECTDHSDRFAPSLTMMWGMATLIDEKTPQPAGFVLKEK